MIQRIQSLWLLIAAGVTALLFKLPVFSVQVSETVHKDLMASQKYLLFIMASVLILFQLTAIFLFRNRGNQKILIRLSLLLQAVLLGSVWMEVNDFLKTEPVSISSSYQAGAALPLVAMVFLVLALDGIRKDERLIKSADKLR